MRLIKVDLPPYYLTVVNQGLQKYPELQKIGVDFFADVLAIVALGGQTCGKFFATASDLSNEIQELYRKGKVRNMAVEEAEYFKTRMDLIEFSEAEFVERFREIKVLTLEEKFEIILQILESMRAAAERIKQNGHPSQNGQHWGGAGNTLSQQVQTPMTGGAQGGGAQGGRMNSAFFKGFSHIFGSYLDQLAPPGGSNTSGAGASKEVAALDDKFREDIKNKMTIAKFVENFYANDHFKIFQIARNIGRSFETSKTGKFEESDQISSNLSVRRMRKQSDIVRAHKMEMVLGEELFDRKVMMKNLKVNSYRVRRQRKQCLYALLDHSGSTNCNNRLFFIKGLAIGLGRKALADGSVFYCRWFDGGVRSLFVLRHHEDWKGFLSYILNVRPAGGTDIDFAMQTAVSDIDKGEHGLDKADVIVITDGTEDIHKPTYDEMVLHKVKGKHFHMVMLEECGLGEDAMYSQKLCESFQFMDSNKAMLDESYVPEFRSL